MATNENSIIESLDESSHLFLFFSSSSAGRCSTRTAPLGKLTDLKVAG